MSFMERLAKFARDQYEAEAEECIDSLTAERDELKREVAALKRQRDEAHDWFCERLATAMPPTRKEWEAFERMLSPARTAELISLGSSGKEHRADNPEVDGQRRLQGGIPHPQSDSGAPSIAGAGNAAPDPLNPTCLHGIPAYMRCDQCGPATCNPQARMYSMLDPATCNVYKGGPQAEPIRCALPAGHPTPADGSLGRDTHAGLDRTGVLVTFGAGNAESWEESKAAGLKAHTLDAGAPGVRVPKPGGCGTCGGSRKVHELGHSHLETEALEPCPFWHFGPCPDCAKAAITGTASSTGLCGTCGDGARIVPCPDCAKESQ